MYLKKLQAQGFKSFADKTTFLFEENINGIVGPNGSGKSNLVDAVRFVLGEQSSKNLRGDGNMMDVIFSGSKTRKPAGSASVTLFFDNTDHHLNIAYDEVSIKRVIYKTGENEYYLNGEKCRLKHISDLMTDSSASKQSFNIISQGKMADILSGSSISRRSIIEEAAGVIKYKKRKEEALRKLDRTHLNLNRINDIISEISGQLEPLAKQSELAKKYESVKENLNNLEIALITNDIEKLNNDIKEYENNIAKINDEVLNDSVTTSTNDAEIVKNKEKLKKVEEEINLYQGKLLKATEDLEKLNTELKLLKERNKYKLNSDEVSRKSLEIKEDILKTNTLITNINNEIEVSCKEISTINLDNDKLLAKYNSLRKQVNSINDEIDNYNRMINDYQYKIISLENLINNNSSLPYSVKAVLNNHTLKGVHNAFGNLLETDSKYSVALSVALGGACNNIVVENENVASSCIQFLKEGNIGRATFYPLNIIKGRSIPSDVLTLLKDCPYFINTLDKLVAYKAEYTDIVLRELGSIIVVNDLDGANKVSKLVNQRYKIVTLDGQVINAGGSITGGNISKQSNVIRDKYELERLEKELKNITNTIDADTKKVGSLSAEVYKLNDLINNNKGNISVIQSVISSKQDNLSILNDKLVSLNNELNGLVNNNDSSEDKLLSDILDYTNRKNEIKTKLEILTIEKDSLNDNINILENENKKIISLINKKNKELSFMQIESSKDAVRLDNLLNTLNEEYSLTFEAAFTNYKLEMDIEEAREKVSNLKEQIKDIGVVNLGATLEYERVSTRYNFLLKQKDDLTNAEDMLLQIITQMDDVVKEKFSQTFDKVNKEFGRVFKMLFGGGEAYLKLTTPDDLLETGIDIMAVPAGKNLKSISLLSGGEKTLTAIALLFAVLNIKPVPFCILDEVEAALDEANVARFGEYLSIYRDKTQFILITHKKKTMEYADILYGITMQESGVSKLVSVKLEDVGK